MVKETIPEDVLNAHPGLTAGQDFLVFVPTTTPDGKAWDYNVTVYPKNTAGGITKQVKDAGKNVGDDIVYTVEADIPPASDGTTLKKYEIWDKIDTTKLDPADKDWPTSSSVAFADDTEIDAEYYDVTFDGVTIKVVFKEDGLKFLAQKDNQGKKVKLTINAKMKAIGDSDSAVIENDATLITRQPGSETDTEVTTDKVKTYLGKVKVLKTADGRDNEKALSGAKFELYRCTADTVAGLGDQITINNVSTWETGADGTLTIDGLHATNFADNAPVNLEGMYCLKEVAAPAGYVLPQGDAAVFGFKLTADTDTDAVALGSDTVTLVNNQLNITNDKSDTPDLPLTGGQGIALLVLGGALVGGLAVYSARRNSVDA